MDRAYERVTTRRGEGAPGMAKLSLYLRVHLNVGVRDNALCSCIKDQEHADLRREKS